MNPKEKTKFILALRHPMDTIFSCWIQNFKLNPAMANMVDLDRIVEFYCVAMEIFQICRSNYNLRVHEIRYEDLIDNFENEVNSLLQFLNLNWEHGLVKFHLTAQKRKFISTPSYSQVIQPIYKDSSYKWKNYSQHLSKYFNIVEPWVRKHGYESLK